MNNPIPESHRDLIDGPVLVALTTIMPDGRPHTTPIWCNSKEGLVWVNTARGRQKDKNMIRDPRISILAVDPGDNYRFLSIEGKVVEVTEQGAVDHIHELARLYTDHLGYYGYFQKEEMKDQETRIIFKVQPTRILKSG